MKCIGMDTHSKLPGHFERHLRSWPAIRVLSSWWWWGKRGGRMTTFMMVVRMVWKSMRFFFKGSELWFKEKGLSLRCCEFLMICNRIGNHSEPLIGCHFTVQVQTATASGEEKDQLAAEITKALTQEPVVGEFRWEIFPQNSIWNPENLPVISRVLFLFFMISISFGAKVFKD